MSTMPVIDNDMIDLFRRMGKRRGTYRGAAMARQRVELQRSCGCRRVNDFCVCPNGNRGVCDRDLDCVMPIDDGSGRLPQF